jgi:PqqD family protein of HPr-rel-A system
METVGGSPWRSAKLVWKPLGDEWVVYNIASGSTHVLSPNAVQALRALENAPLTSFQVAQKLSDFAHVSVDEEIARQVESLLLKLEEMGLVDAA